MQESFKSLLFCEMILIFLSALLLLSNESHTEYNFEVTLLYFELKEKRKNNNKITLDYYILWV